MRLESKTTDLPIRLQRNAACFPIEIIQKDISCLNTGVEIETSLCFIVNVFLGPRIPPCLSRRLPEKPTLVVGKLWSDILRAVTQDFLSVCQALFPRALQ